MIVYCIFDTRFQTFLQRKLLLVSKKVFYVDFFASIKWRDALLFIYLFKDNIYFLTLKDKVCEFGFYLIGLTFNISLWVLSCHTLKVMSKFFSIQVLSNVASIKATSLLKMECWNLLCSILRDKSMNIKASTN